MGIYALLHHLLSGRAGVVIVYIILFSPHHYIIYFNTFQIQEMCEDDLQTIFISRPQHPIQTSNQHNKF